MKPLTLGHDFARPELLEQALTHASYTHEHGAPHNETLEFLGDGILNACTAALLFERFPEADQGELTRLRSTLVNTKHLATLGRRLDLGPLLRVSKGEHQTGGRDRDAMLEDAVEALIGAVFVDAGFDACLQVMRVLLREDLQHLRQLGAERRRNIRNPRSALQELTQGHWKLTPQYEDLDPEGTAPDVVFHAQVRVGERIMGKGSGSKKKEAYKAAASQAIKRVRREVEPPSEASEE